MRLCGWCSPGSRSPEWLALTFGWGLSAVRVWVLPRSLSRSGGAHGLSVTRWGDPSDRGCRGEPHDGPAVGDSPWCPATVVVVGGFRWGIERALGVRRW